MFEFRACQMSVFVELCSRSCNVITSVILNNGNKGRNEIRDGTLEKWWREQKKSCKGGWLKEKSCEEELKEKKTFQLGELYCRTCTHLAATLYYSSNFLVLVGRRTIFHFKADASCAQEPRHGHWQPNFFVEKPLRIIMASNILGDPGAVSGDGKRSKRARKKFGRWKVKKAKKSPFLTFLRSFRLFSAPTNCPWVSEDGLKRDKGKPCMC